MKTTLIIAIFFSLIINPVLSQDSCKVLKPEIAGKYTGKCKDGLAHGKGISEGIDKYDGKFKFGLPDGKGRYVYSTGEVYEGLWSEGKKAGEGKLYYIVNGVDSIKHGIWKNDVFYAAILPSPYEVLKSTSVSRYSFRRAGDGNKVLFYITQNNSPAKIYGNFIVENISGTYFAIGPKRGFENIIFPFKCRIMFGILNAYRSGVINVEFEFIINKPGSWELQINI